MLFVGWLRRNRKLVTTTYPGEKSLDDVKDVAIFVHFDRCGQVHDYIMFYLRALRDAGFEILFVSNGRGLTREALARVSPLCVGILCRRNVGYDFGAYRDGLRWLGNPSRFRRILLANDSVYGPFFDLKTVLARCDDSASVWGMTDSWSGGYHLQSYFLLLNHSTLVSTRFGEFWDELLLLQSKRLIIRHYEIGFTKTMLRDGLRCDALFRYRTAAQDFALASNAGKLSNEALTPKIRDFFASVRRHVDEGRPLNPMHHFWDHMIGNLHCPFIKRELLARNPARIPHAYLWERLIRSVSTYDISLIVRHLQTTTRNRAP
jgi:lipopolysaccharide biosynthesis protein